MDRTHSAASPLHPYSPACPPTLEGTGVSLDLPPPTHGKGAPGATTVITLLHAAAPTTAAGLDSTSGAPGGTDARSQSCSSGDESHSRTQAEVSCYTSVTCTSCYPPSSYSSSTANSYSSCSSSPSSSHQLPLLKSTRRKFHDNSQRSGFCGKMGSRGWSLRHAFLVLLLVSALLLLLSGNNVWPKAMKPDVLMAWSPEQQRDLGRYVRPQQPTALLQPLQPCTGDEMVVFVVPSKPSNVKNRNAIRDTWGQWVRGHPYVKHRKIRDLMAASSLPAGEEDLQEEEPYYVLWDEYLEEGEADEPGTMERFKRQSSLPGNDTHAAKLNKKGRKVYRSALSSNFATMRLDLKFKLVFLLGRDEHSDEPSKEVLLEQDKHGDILLEDFIDSYQNLTIKSVFLLKYIKDACPLAKFVAKVDDDMFIHVPNLQNTLLDEKLPKDLVLGCLFCNARPILNPWNKWYSPSHMFKGDKFPNYLSGTSYVISGSMVRPLLDTAIITPLFHLEDVFITGILPAKLGVRPTDNIGFSYLARPLNPCLYQNVTAGHEVAPGHMYRLWNLLHLPAILRSCKPLTEVQVRNYKPSKCVWR